MADTSSPQQFTQILRKQKVLEMVGISNSTLYAWMAADYFPRPVRIGPRLIGWPVESIQNFLASRAKATA